MLGTPKNRRAALPAEEHYFFFAVFFLAVVFVPHFFPQAIEITSSNKNRTAHVRCSSWPESKHHGVPETTFFIATPIKS